MSSGRLILTFDAGHFLIEAIREFLESGADPPKIASAVIKVATGVELLLKDRLERICPALILEKIDAPALQVAKAFNLHKHMTTPKELDGIELKTANFDTLLKRASKFIKLSKAEPHLRELHKIRNRLIHHKGEVDLLETNLLLVQHVFPFIEQLSRSAPRMQWRLESNLWKKIRRIEKDSIDAFSSQLSKKVAHHDEIAKKLTSKQLKHRLGLTPEKMESDEEITGEALRCPACHNDGLAAFGSFDVDVDDETGQPIAGYYSVMMRCRVCGAEFNRSEIEHIMNHFENFFGADEVKNKTDWGQAIEDPEPDG